MATNAQNELAIVTPEGLFDGILDALETMKSLTTDDVDRAMISNTLKQAEFLYHGMRAGIETMKEQRNEAVAELDGMFEALEDVEENEWYFQIKQIVEKRVLSEFVPGMMRDTGMTRTQCEEFISRWIPE